MLKVNVISGDIVHTETPVDAIVALINPRGDWFGNINNAILVKCGWHYHSNLDSVIKSQEKEILDGQIFFIKGDKRFKDATFKDVIFIIDKLTLTTETLTFFLLKTIEDQKDHHSYQRIAIPVMRTGATVGKVERNVEDSIVAMKKGIDSFKKHYFDSNLTLDIIVYKDPYLKKLVELNF